MRSLNSLRGLPLAVFLATGGRRSNFELACPIARNPDLTPDWATVKVKVVWAAWHFPMIVSHSVRCLAGSELKICHLRSLAAEYDYKSNKDRAALDLSGPRLSAVTSAVLGHRVGMVTIKINLL